MSENAMKLKGKIFPKPTQKMFEPTIFKPKEYEHQL